MIITKEKKQLKRNGVTLNQIQNELDYRDIAGKDSKWDDDLWDYTIEELEQLETELSR